MVRRTSIDKDVWYDTDILVIVVVHGVTFLTQYLVSHFSRCFLHHVKFGVLRVLSEVIQDFLLLARITKSKRPEVVLQAEFIVGVRFLGLEFLNEPHVTVCGEEKLARHLVHLMFTNDPASDSIV